MKEINVTRQRESDIQSYSNEEFSDGSYENYRSSSLPEGYTPYREPRQADEAVYDQYDPACYETPGQEAKPKLCGRNVSFCKKGWL